MNYEELLNRAMEKLPKNVEKKDRFEVPKIFCEVSGSKTVLKNFGEILAVLRREPSHLAKYLSKGLATSGSVQGNSLIFQGKIYRENLQKKIDDYVKEFVYCKECGKPDTKLAKEGRIYFLVCEACGARHPARSI
jgi:translation initiation factor 2 subunit 2